MMKNALPALLTLWGIALLGLAAMDWAGYGTFLLALVLSR
jgi:hypothetical protein